MAERWTEGLEAQHSNLLSGKPVDQTPFFQSTLHPNSLLQQKSKNAAYQTPAEPSQDPCEWECVLFPATGFLELFVIRPSCSKSWLIYLSDLRWEALTQPQRSQSPHLGPHQSLPLRSWAGWGCCRSQGAGLSWWLPWTWVQPAGTPQSGAETTAAAGIETPGTSETRSYKRYWPKAAQENRIPGWRRSAFLPASWRAWATPRLPLFHKTHPGYALSNCDLPPSLGSPLCSSAFSFSTASITV